MLDQHDARVGVRGLGVRVRVALDVGAIVVAERRRPLPDPLAQDRRVLRRRVERDPQRQALRVDEVVGARRTDVGQLRRVARGHELEHARRRVDDQHLRPLARDGPAQHRQHLAQQRRALVLLDGGAVLDAAEARRAVRLRIDEVGRAVDGVERAAVGLLGGVAPDDEAVLGEHDELEPGVGAHRLADLLGQREPGADVRDPRGRGPEALAHEALAVARAREHVDRVGVRVMDVVGRHERVQQRLDRRARRGRVGLAAGEVGDHVLVGHLVALDEREHLLQAQRREVLRAHRREVAARPLDPHDALLTADVVGRRALRGGVAAAEVRHRTVAAEQVRGEQDLPERVVGHRARVLGPAVLGPVDHPCQRCHRPHPPATPAVAPRSFETRSTYPDERCAATGSSAAPPSARTFAHSGRTSVR